MKSNNSLTCFTKSSSFCWYSSSHRCSRSLAIVATIWSLVQPFFSCQLSCLLSSSTFCTYHSTTCLIHSTSNLIIHGHGFLWETILNSRLHLEFERGCAHVLYDLMHLSSMFYYVSTLLMAPLLCHESRHINYPWFSVFQTKNYT